MRQRPRICSNARGLCNRRIICAQLQLRIDNQLSPRNIFHPHEQLFRAIFANKTFNTYSMDDSDEDLYGPSENVTAQSGQGANAAPTAAGGAAAPTTNAATNEEEEEYEEVEESDDVGYRSNCCGLLRTGLLIVLQDEWNIITEATPETIANLYVQVKLSLTAKKALRPNRRSDKRDILHYEESRTDNLQIQHQYKNIHRHPTQALLHPDQTLI